MRKTLMVTLAVVCLGLQTFAQGRLEKVLLGRSRAVDLTYSLSSKIPYWPGEQYKPFEFKTIATYEQNGVFSGLFTMPEHMGTHLDAPNHFVAGRIPVDQIATEQLIAPAVVIDVREQVAKDPDYRVTRDDIRQWERKHGRIPRRSLVFAYTGWEARWDKGEAYLNRDEKGIMHFPGFSAEAAEFLVKQRDVRGLGIDTLSVDVGPSKDYPVHHIILGAGKYALENLARLGQLPPRGAIVIVGVIPIAGGSGGPARVLALLP